MVEGQTDGVFELDEWKLIIEWADKVLDFKGHWKRAEADNVRELGFWSVSGLQLLMVLGWRSHCHFDSMDIQDVNIARYSSNELIRCAYYISENGTRLRHMDRNKTFLVLEL